MTPHDKASAVAAKLRGIRLDVIVTAEDILAKCSSEDELDFYYAMLMKEA